MNKYLIVGLGNIGAEYEGTRHNAGFMVLDALAEELGLTFEPRRYAARAEGRVKNKQLVLIKPSTYMNLSGNAVRYWAKEESIPLENILVVVDDLALPYGTLRLKAKGSSGGHNGLKHIEVTLGTANYARLRFGIGSNFGTGQQVAYVLDTFTPEEQAELPALCRTASEVVKGFALAGVQVAMNSFNKKNNRPTPTPQSVKREQPNEGGTGTEDR